ncbi:unnamed protein product [Prunus armeniaca]
MELTKAIKFGHGTENLGNGLLMLVEMWKKMSKVGDIGYDPYEFTNVIGMEINPCTLVAAKLLILQGDLLPGGNTLPSSMYEAKKTLSALGTSYEKIHACPNDCILYRKDYEESTNCPTCGISRWKEAKIQS